MSNPTTIRSVPTKIRLDPTRSRSDPTKDRLDPTRIRLNPIRIKSTPTWPTSDPGAILRIPKQHVEKITAGQWCIRLEWKNYERMLEAKGRDGARPLSLPRATNLPAVAWPMPSSASTFSFFLPPPLPSRPPSSQQKRSPQLIPLSHTTSNK